MKAEEVYAMYQDGDTKRFIVINNNTGQKLITFPNTPKGKEAAERHLNNLIATRPRTVNDIMQKVFHQ